MQKHLIIFALLAVSFSLSADDKGWISLFDGKTLTGWKESGAPGSFRVEDGKLVANGKPMGHLFYTGRVNGGVFRNFELKVDVMTRPKANSGVYFHTQYQPKGWPKAGFEAQVNATHGDRLKSGGIYGVADVEDVAPHKDNVWWEYHLKVVGRKVTIRVNGKTTMVWTQPKDWKGRFPDRKLNQGTFALQAHDPDSIVYYRNIRVRPID